MYCFSGQQDDNLMVLSLIPVRMLRCCRGSEVVEAKSLHSFPAGRSEDDQIISLLGTFTVVVKANIKNILNIRLSFMHMGG